MDTEGIASTRKEYEMPLMAHRRLKFSGRSRFLGPEECLQFPQRQKSLNGRWVDGDQDQSSVLKLWTVAPYFC